MKHEELLNRVRFHAKEEKRFGALVIQDLIEVERTKAYAEIRYSSIYEFCRDDLGYSENEAYAKVAAMKLVKEVPQIKESLDNNKITLSTLILANRFFNQEEKEYAAEEKLELIKSLEGKSKQI